ncbi:MULTISPECIES: D-alanyl-D-alanine carboxypeptidase family protein [Microbacterium]|uniref:D-alanyl-D-alanine carboxypeptidase family protein n=1 Tax=Microbacterium TaxID=33882 RepID=UPI00277F2398|nr:MULTISPECIES: D-alanyl-D-alanine carboxypeptidase [Microbacterium]MDQ1075347.1 D-alanyl-D-alanine carboxypeptidase (penicillin-binding protein 5/6) [Microbacterium sp. SORGH_AS_0969]MDQ1115578.1 D-alanyl-D-alanine carboxypeptidase (penicillin-binding protein 5/6) [Microbacterium testaceum]
MHEQTPATRRAARDSADLRADEAMPSPNPAPATTAADVPLPSGTAPAAEVPDAPADGATSPEPDAAAPASAPVPVAQPASAAAPQPAPTAPATPPEPGASASVPSPAPQPDPTSAALGALGWVDPDAAAAPRPAPAFVVSGATGRPVDLLAGRRRRRILRPATVVPTILLILLIGAYTATTLLWPLNAVQPTVTPIALQPTAAPPADPAWPAQGEAAIALEGVPGELSSSASAPESIASITKIVTALVVLDRLPLSPGEQGPSYAFTQADSADYWQYRARGESSLDVPVDGSLTELQMLQGMLIASANNYAQRLASDLFPSNADFAAAANAYLAERGITGITIVNPTGIEAGNTATPAALIALAEKALANPVIAEIVRTPELTLPGAGSFKNGNPLLADPGVVGVKTGTLDAWNLLSAKDFTIGTVTVRAYAAVLGQPGPDERNQATRDLYARIAEELQPRPSVTSGTVIGRVKTLWGQESNVVTTSDATVVLWNSAVAGTSTRFDLGDSRAAGDDVGTLTVTGPLNTDTVDAQLTDTIDPPDPLWRLTHPLDLFGLNG